MPLRRFLARLIWLYVLPLLLSAWLAVDGVQTNRTAELTLYSSVGLDYAGVSPSSPALLPEGEGSNSPLPQGEGLGVRVKRMDTCIASDSDCPTEESRLTVPNRELDAFALFPADDDSVETQIERTDTALNRFKRAIHIHRS